MSLATLLTLYLFFALLIFWGLNLWKQRKGQTATTTLCPTCGERHIIKKKRGLTRCPQCGSLHESL